MTLSNRLLFNPIFLMIFYVGISLIACTSTSFKKDEVISKDGIWLQLGYGKIFEIAGDSVKIYDVSSVECRLFEQELLASNGVIDRLTADSLILKKNIKTYRFTRMKELPKRCSMITSNPQDPILNFEVFWNTFNEQYCFFDKRNIDWDEIYHIYRGKISEKTSQLELFLLFDEIITLLDDGHVQLEEPDILEDTLASLSVAEPQQSARPLMNRFELGDKIAEIYCEDVSSHNAGIAKWGMLDNGMGYVQLNAMWLLAYYDLPSDLPLREFVPIYGEHMDTRVFQRQDEIDGADRLSDIIFEDLQKANAIIIDLRFNTGGKDEVGLEILGHLVKEKKLIGSKKARLDEGFANHQNIYLQPREPHYAGNVYVLSSLYTASAAELALIATIPLENVQIIGSNSEGILSDRLEKGLPNGWEYSLSNEIYLDINGIDHEGVGINPDISLDYPAQKASLINQILHQLDTTGDMAIEEAIRIEAQNRQK